MSGIILLLVTLAVGLLVYLLDDNTKRINQQKDNIYNVLPCCVRPNGIFQVDFGWLENKFRFMKKYYDEFLIASCVYDNNNHIYHIYLELVNLKPEYKTQINKLPELFEKYTEKVLLEQIANTSDLVYYFPFYEALTINAHVMVGNSDNARQYIHNLKLERQRKRLSEQQKLDKEIRSQEYDIQKGIIETIKLK